MMLLSKQLPKQRVKQKAGLNILIVDDDSLNQRLLNIVLARDNHEITFAYSGNEAINAINQHQFDLIFMDIQIPDMDGFEICTFIRNSNSPNKQTPIVALTALSAQHESLQDYLNNGFINDCIFKPFETKHIEQVIASVRTGKGLVYSNAVQKDPKKAPILETENILPFFNNDPQNYTELFMEFLQALPEKIKKMQESAQEQDWQLLSLLAHNLTGVAANFGAMKLSALAQQLDNEAGQKKMTAAHDSLENIERNVLPLKKAFIALRKTPAN